MAVTDNDFEAMRVRATVVSLALQSLIARMTTSGALGGGDLVAMRETALELAEDLGRALGRPELGSKMLAEAERWWTATEDAAGV